MTLFIEQFLSKYQSEFSKGFSAQHFLNGMLEKWKRSIDGGNFPVVLLTNLSKVFNCLPQVLIIVKLNVYEFSLSALRLILLINNNVAKRKQKNPTKWATYTALGKICDALCDLVPIVQTKNVKNTHEEVLLLIKLQASDCNLTKNNTSSWVFFTFFKLCKWYQIAQSLTYSLQSSEDLQWAQFCLIFVLGTYFLSSMI